jgi:hypothetical protein
MTTKPTEVGAQDPELRNSPILRDDDEDVDTLREMVDDSPVCYFNAATFADGAIVKSGTALLRCDRGIWVFAGPADPDNP